MGRASGEVRYFTRILGKFHENLLLNHLDPDPGEDPECRLPVRGGLDGPGEEFPAECPLFVLGGEYRV